MRANPLLVLFVFLLAANAWGDDQAPTSDERPALKRSAASIHATAPELIVRAMSLLGVHYKYGGKSPDSGFDCSGFVSHVFKEVTGVALPHNSYQISLVGQKIPNKDLQPGDLVFYNTLRRAFSHVGIYIGDNKFIHSPSRGRSVEIVTMEDSYWLKRYQGARRIPQLASSTNATPNLIYPAQPDIPEAEILGSLH